MMGSRADMISDEHLAILIEGLRDYKARGVVDPWVLEDGSIIEPLEALEELRELRKQSASTV